MKKRTLSMLLVLVLALGILAPTAYAAVPESEGDYVIQPRYTYIFSIMSDLTISSTGRTSDYGYVKMYDSSYTCDLTMELQQKDGSWNTIKEWTTSGSGTVELDKIWYVLSGYTYRVKVTVDVYNSAGKLVETESAYSLEVSY